MTDYLDNSNKKIKLALQLVSGYGGDLPIATSEPIPTLIIMWKWQKRLKKAKFTRYLLRTRRPLVGLRWFGYCHSLACFSA